MIRNAVSYHICPKCTRAVPAESQELFCSNDGTKLLMACPGCSGLILSPYSQFCSRCGHPYAGSAQQAGN